MLKVRTKTSTFLYNKCIFTLNPNHQLLLYHPQENLPLVASFCRNFSRKVKAHSFVVSYLVNSCGLSPESALSASEKVYFETPERPDSVVNFFKHHGFSQTQISKLVTRLPTLLLANCEKTLLPKFEFFKSNGISNLDLPKFILCSPIILKRSLENVIIPNFGSLKKVLRSEERAVRAFKQHPELIYFIHSYVEPNIGILRDNGVPESNVAWLLEKTPKLFVFKSEKLKYIVEDVKKMGFDPAKTQFVRAISVVAFTSKSLWEKKSDAFKKWGWSEEVILEAFRKDPFCFWVSENKVVVIMDLLVNRMGLDPLLIAKHPILLSFSLEKRLKPRAAVFQYLLSNGLIEGCAFAKFILMMRCPHEKFLSEFVDSYKEAPQLLKLYKEQLSASS